MLQQLCSALPEELTGLARLLAWAGAAAGGSLWLFGAHFSRSFLTLVAVAIGAWVGLQLPRWFEIPLAGWATCIVLALMLGVSGYALHRAWIGMGLALLLMLWTAELLLQAYAAPGAALPAYPGKAGFIPYAEELWQALDPALRQVGPLACAGACVVGLATTMIRPRLATLVFYSLLGTTMIVLFGLMARPHLVGLLPQRAAERSVLLAVVVAFGAVVQWRMWPKVAGKSGGGQEK